MLPALKSFVSDANITQRPVSASLFREKTVINDPDDALRELTYLNTYIAILMPAAKRLRRT